MTNLSKNGENIDSGKSLQKQCISLYGNIVLYISLVIENIMYYISIIDTKARYNT